MDELVSNLHMVPMAFMALFPVLNPIGSAFVVYTMTGDLAPAVRRKLSLKIAINAFSMLAFFLFLGADILKLFGLTIPSIQIAGGLVIAAMGWKLLNQEEPSEHQASDSDVSITLVEKKSFYPLTFPISVGPGALSVAITLSAHTTSSHFVSYGRIAVLIGMLAASATIYGCYAYLKVLSEKLSPSANLAVSRILAFLVLCIGVEIACEGARKLF